MEQEKEVWKDVIGFEKRYLISSMGRVKSLKNNIVLKDKPGKSGYCQVKLYGHEKPKTIAVHILVSMSFLGYDPKNKMGMETDHKDNNRLNNRLSNLQVISHRDNVRKEIEKTGTPYFGVHKNNGYTTKWRARLTIDNKMVHLGYFHSDKDAHDACVQKLKQINNNDRNSR